MDSTPQDSTDPAQARVDSALAEFERAASAEPHELAGVFDGVYQQLRAALDAAERV